MSIYLGDIPLANNSVSRNIGEIIQSTIPLSDAGLHLLDGALINGTGSYSAFVTYIAGLVSNYPDLFITETDWQQAVTDYGVCGKFVYDSTNNTVRLPKYSNKIYTSAIATTAGVKGDGKTLGLTDGTTTAGLNGNRYANSTGYGLVPTGSAGTAVGTTGAGGASLAHNVFAGITTDATKSGIIADLSNITTALDGYYYIVIATSTKTDIEVDIDEVMTDLNGKADVDLSNVNVSGTSLASGWSMPSSRYISLAWGASGSTYTAPANGWFYARARSKGTTKITYITLFNETTLLTSSCPVYLPNTSSQYTVQTYIPVKKGQTVDLNYDLASTVDNNVIRFIYAEGEN